MCKLVRNRARNHARNRASVNAPLSQALSRNVHQNNPLLTFKVNKLERFCKKTQVKAVFILVKFILLTAVTVSPDRQYQGL
jgi:hypothetical protein